MNNLPRLFPWFIVGAAGIYLLFSLAPAAIPPEQMQVYEFGKIPVVEGGRVKPIDSLARNSLLIISNRQEYKDANGDMQPAVRWLLDVLVSPKPKVNRSLFQSEAALEHKVFRIENDQVLNLLGLELRPLRWRYSLQELFKNYNKLDNQVKMVEKVPDKQRNLFDQKIWELRRHIELYLELAQFQTPLAIPPQSAEGEWQTFPQALAEMQASGKENPAVVSYSRILMAYARNKPEDFNHEVAEYRQMLAKQMPREVSTAEFEVFFNNFQPFNHCSYLYIGVFLLACLSWVGFREPLSRAAFWLTVLTLLVHTWALGARIYIQGRPPVTNLYSSAVWIGWGSVLLGLILETIFRNSIATVVGSVMGSLTMIIAHHLASAGDTMEMMQAVLDTNFWLATHVTIVTFGYVATYVAGLLGMVFILLGVATKRLDQPLFRSLGQMIYGVVCFATLLSFVGTVLGGIWADQSWGRFWGWDPKENGALEIVLWNALILHARWAGLVKQRGLAVLAVAGNIVTTWSWFGTNQLGVGLHAYGFNNTLVMVCDGVWALCLGFIGLGLIPTRYWRSFAPLPPPPKGQQGPKAYGHRRAPTATARA